MIDPNAKRCEVCGFDLLQHGEATAVTIDLHTFCSESCAMRWQRSRATTAVGGIPSAHAFHPSHVEPATNLGQLAEVHGLNLLPPPSMVCEHHDDAIPSEETLRQLVEEEADLVGRVFEPEDDQIDHPSHYGGADNPYEVIKVQEAWCVGLKRGQALGYIARSSKKGQEQRDLGKALWYLNRHLKHPDPVQVGSRLGQDHGYGVQDVVNSWQLHPMLSKAIWCIYQDDCDAARYNVEGYMALRGWPLPTIT